MNAFLHLWSHRDSLRRVIGRKAAIWLALGAGAGLLVAVVEILLSFQVGKVLQLIGAVQLPAEVSGSGGGSFRFFAFSLLALGILRGIGYFFISQSGIVAQESIMLRLRVLAFQETFQREEGFISLSKLSALVADVFPKATLLCLGLANFVPAVVQLGVICGILGYKSPLLTAIGISGIGIVGWIIHLANVQVRGIASRFPNLFETLMNRMNRMTKNWFFLRAVRKIGDEYQALVNASVDFADSIIRAYYLGNSAAVLPQSLGIIVILGVIAAQMRYQPLPAMAFVSFLYLYFRFIQVLGQLAATYSAVNSNYHHFSLAMSYVGKLEPAAFPQAMQAIEHSYAPPASAAQRSAQSRATLAGTDELAPPEIQVENASFRYQSDLPWTVENFSLRVPSGGRMALMGPSGSGKSTILALCLGVLRPQSGSIRIGGLEPADFFEKYSHRLGYVGAEPFLIEGSVRDNLVYGLDRACPDSELLEALEKVSLKDWATSLARPLDHRLSEMGEGLSTGQKQRLMLARALLRKPVLLVLDEMSANLDAQSEQEMKQLIARLSQCTVLTVSHRMDFVRDTHEILSLATS